MTGQLLKWSSTIGLFFWEMWSEQLARSLKAKSIKWSPRTPVFTRVLLVLPFTKTVSEKTNNHRR